MLQDDAFAFVPTDSAVEVENGNASLHSNLPLDPRRRALRHGLKHGYADGLQQSFRWCAWSVGLIDWGKPVTAGVDWAGVIFVWAAQAGAGGVMGGSRASRT